MKPSIWANRLNNFEKYILNCIANAINYRSNKNLMKKRKYIRFFKQFNFTLTILIDCKLYCISKMGQYTTINFIIEFFAIHNHNTTLYDIAVSIEQCLHSGSIFFCHFEHFLWLRPSNFSFTYVCFMESQNTANIRTFEVNRLFL